MRNKYQRIIKHGKRFVSFMLGVCLMAGIFSPVQVSAKTSGKAVLPDFSAYLNDNAKVTKTNEEKNYTEIQYKVASKDTGIITDYIDLICEDYDFNLFDTYGTSTKLYSIEYTGSATVKPFNFGRYKEDKAVYITVSEISGNLWVGLTYSNDLDYTDTSERTKYALKNANETTTTTKTVKETTAKTIAKTRTKTTATKKDSSYSNDSYYIGKSWSNQSSSSKDCTKCNGSGTVPCSRCNESGSIKEYVSVPNYAGNPYGNSSKWVNVSCPSCKNGNVTCKTCYGTGKI